MVDGLSQAGLRAALLVATLAALVVLAGLFSDAVRYACLGVIAAATLLCAGERRRPDGGWWLILGVGTGLSVVGAALAEASETAGGLVAVIGGALVVIGATVGFPAGDGSA